MAPVGIWGGHNTGYLWSPLYQSTISGAKRVIFRDKDAQRWEETKKRSYGRMRKLAAHPVSEQDWGMWQFSENLSCFKNYLDICSVWSKEYTFVPTFKTALAKILATLGRRCIVVVLSASRPEKVSGISKSDWQMSNLSAALIYYHSTCQTGVSLQCLPNN